MVQDRWNTCIFFCSFPKSIYEMKCISKLYYLRLWSKLGGLKQQTFLVSHSLVGIREHFTWEFPAEGLSRGCNQDVGWAGGWAAAIWRRYGPGVCGRAPSRGCWQKASASYHGASAQRCLSDLLTWHLASSARVTPEMEGKAEASVSFLT